MSELKTRKPSVRLRPMLLHPGDRFIFSSGMGGNGEIVTVKTVEHAMDTAYIYTDELDFAIESLTINTVKLA